MVLDRAKLIAEQAAMREKIEQNIKEKIKGGLDRQTATHLHICLILKQGLVREERELLNILPNINPREIKRAQVVAAEQSPAGDTLRKLVYSTLVEITARPESVVPGVPETQTVETVGELLRRVAKKHFNVDPDKSNTNENRARAKLARWAMIRIAQISLKMDPEEVAKIAEVKVPSIELMERDGREEYLAKDTFYKKVQDICKELGVPAP